MVAHLAPQDVSRSNHRLATTTMAQTQNLPPAYGGHPGYPGPPHPQYDHRQQLSMQANGQAMQAAPPVTQTAHIISQTKDNLKYSLVVVQQPIRARMCGFGDKVSNHTRGTEFGPSETFAGPKTHHSSAMCAPCRYRYADTAGGASRVCAFQSCVQQARLN